MPTYDYVCSGCGHEMEFFQSMKDDPISLCPACGKKKLKRQIGLGAGIIFKGSGFYETDYRKSVGDGEAKSGESKGTPEGEGGSKEKPAASPATGEKAPAADAKTTPAGKS